MKNLGFEKIRVYHDETKGKDSTSFVVEPCEIGFGTTIGNSLRRVLMSSMPGAAVVGFKSEGVIHEFMTIPGTATDTTELIFALKNLRFRVEGEGLKTIRLSTKKAGVYTSDELILPEGVSLLTKGMKMLNVLGKDTVDIEIYVRNGRGFLLAADNTDFVDTEGVIEVDGRFTPVKKVSYDVRPFRVGNNTDFEQLVMDVKTDGSIDPLEAIGLAAKILNTHYSFFDDIKGISEKIEITQEKKEEEEFVLNKTIAELELSVRSANGLNISHIKTLGELTNLDESELRALKNIGDISVAEIKQKLAEYGLKLRND